jgi:hypothetical protein
MTHPWVTHAIFLFEFLLRYGQSCKKRHIHNFPQTENYCSIWSFLKNYFIFFWMVQLFHFIMSKATTFITDILGAKVVVVIDSPSIVGRMVIDALLWVVTSPFKGAKDRLEESQILLHGINIDGENLFIEEKNYFFEINSL